MLPVTNSSYRNRSLMTMNKLVEGWQNLKARIRIHSVHVDANLPFPVLD